ncbi:MAG: hypothetical protein ABIT01_09720, partial [Thermoanaerobaculia bacterium]
AVANLEALMRPTATFLLTASHDDQPADRGTAAARIGWGLDPLTTATAELSGLTLNAEDAGGRRGLADARVGISGRFPSLALNVALRAGARRFSDASAVPIFDVQLERTAGAFELALLLARDTALDSAPSYRSHVTTETLALGLRRPLASGRAPGSTFTFAAEVRASRFADENAALAASAWAELPLGHVGPVRLAGTVAASYRDTRDVRVRGVFVGSSLLPAGGFAYEIRTPFDPYVTPERQLEARAGFHAVLPASASLTLSFTGEAGAGRERATGFGPSTGTTPLPVSLAPGSYSRRYAPYRLAFSGTYGTGMTTLQAEVGHASSAFYEVTSVDLRVTRRF